MSYLICGDDGHGLTRNGAFRPTAGKRTPPFDDGSVVYENEFNRDACAAFLAACARCGMRTIEAAPGDEDVPLADRARRAREAKADALVSFHYNAGAKYEWGDGKRGVSVHVHTSRCGARGLQLAKNLLEEVVRVRAPRKNRGIGRSAFYIVNESNTRCPSALIEAGFMDNPTEARWMREAAYRREVGEAACRGVCAFFGLPYVKEGRRAVDVRDLQRALAQAGFDPVWIDGKMGPKTAAAVRDAQRALGMREDPEALAELLEKLGSR